MTGGALEVVLDAHAEVAEGPTWDAARGALLWVDIYRNAVHLLDPASGHDRFIDVGQPVGAVATSMSVHLIVALRDGFGQLDPDDGTVELLVEVAADFPDTLMNDGKCDHEGRFLAGTTTLSETPRAAALYRLNTDFTVQAVLTDVTLSNGIDWSPDGRTMYYVDSAHQRIDMFDYELDGTLRHRRPFATIPPEAGMPDGLTVDAEGCIWLALWGGSAVRRYAPSGAPESEIRLPVSLVTSCAFGGPDWEELYITTSSWQFDHRRLRAEPHAGAIFVTRPGVAGVPARPFGTRCMD